MAKLGFHTEGRSSGVTSAGASAKRQSRGLVFHRFQVWPVLVTRVSVMKTAETQMSRPMFRFGSSLIGA